ncbi:MAG: hypothetical protein ACP5N2_02870 [Candidatus Nanoarchaeia archaeon]
MHRKKLVKWVIVILLVVILLLVLLMFKNLREECKCPLNSRPAPCEIGEEQRIIEPARFIWYCPACPGGVSCMVTE